jgi:hypothetical protein
VTGDTAAPLRIAFLGPPGSGKTTSAWLLQRMLRRATIISVAAPLREIESFIYRVAGLVPPSALGSQDGVMLQRIREFLELRRPQFLEESFVARVRSCADDMPIINDDARLALLPTLKAFNFTLAWVEGHHLAGRQDISIPEATDNPHDAVVNRDNCDVTVENRGTIGDLERALHETVLVQNRSNER